MQSSPAALARFARAGYRASCEAASASLMRWSPVAAGHAPALGARLEQARPALLGMSRSPRWLFLVIVVKPSGRSKEYCQTRSVHVHHPELWRTV